MKRTLSTVALLLALAGTTRLVAGTITGRVLGADGRPPLAADVHIYTYGGQIGMAPLESASVGADGSYTITVPEGLAHTIIVTGVDHNYASVTLPTIAPADRVDLDITLPRLPYTSSIDAVKIVGDWNGFNFESATEMKRLPNGTFAYDIKMPKGTPEAAYQILGVVGEGEMRFQRSVNVPGAPRFVYDGAGDYRSVTSLKNGRARIIFDPKAINRSGATEPTFAFRGASEWINRVAAVAQIEKNVNMLLQQRQKEFMPIQMQAQETGSPLDTSALNAIVDRYRPRIREAMLPLHAALADPHPTVRQFAAIAAAGGRGVDSAFASEILRALPASDPLWQLNPRGLGSLEYRIPNSEREAFTAAVNANPWSGAGLRIMVGRMQEAGYGGDIEKAEQIYREISEKYGEALGQDENQDVVAAMQDFNPARAIKVGKMIPDFEVKLMDGRTVSRTSMMGRTYMMDFWAVWCGPCRGELPGLHIAYDKFKPRGLEVLSLSFDQKPGDVTKFRKSAKTPMPWLHTFVEGGFENPLSQAFEVDGIPKPILVGPDGRILAIEMDLRGPALEKTLETFLPADRAAR